MRSSTRRSDRLTATSETSAHVHRRGGSQVVNYFAKTEGAESGDDGTAGNRPANLASGNYFMTTRVTCSKHPGGAWQGEHSIDMGREAPTKSRCGRGSVRAAAPDLAAHPVTEDQMLAEMVEPITSTATKTTSGPWPPPRRPTAGPRSELDPANKAFPEKLRDRTTSSTPSPAGLQVNGGPNDSFVRQRRVRPRLGIRRTSKSTKRER